MDDGPATFREECRLQTALKKIDALVLIVGTYSKSCLRSKS
jgi:hypothetical protein